MVFLDAMNSALDSLDAASSLDRFGISLPPDGQRWLDRLTELQATRPPQPRHNKCAELVAHGADEAEYNAAVWERQVWPDKCRDWQEAERIAGQHILTAIRVDAGRIHAELRVIAAEVIGRLHRAAQLTQSVNDLVRADRPDEARLVVHAPTDLATLEQLYEVRDLYLVPNGTQWSTGRWDASRWENPQDLRPENVHGETPWDYCAANIRGGGKLWYPTLSEATAASSRHEPSNLIEAIDPRRSTASAFAG